MTTVENLKKGQTLLIDAKKVNGEKIMLQFAEIVQSREAESAASILNASDARFTQPKARRHWLAVTAQDLKEVFGIVLADDQEILVINRLNPVSLKEGAAKGKRIRIVINETTKGTQYQMENIEKTAKRAGADGPIMTSGGLPIFPNLDLVFTNEEPKHVILTADKVSAVSSVSQNAGEPSTLAA